MTARTQTNDLMLRSASANADARLEACLFPDHPSSMRSSSGAVAQTKMRSSSEAVAQRKTLLRVRVVW